MRAGGRGGRQGPRGDPVPPRALLAFMGMCARTRPSLAFMGRLCAQVPFRALNFIAISLFVEEFCLDGLPISDCFVIAL